MTNKESKAKHKNTNIFAEINTSFSDKDEKENTKIKPVRIIRTSVTRNTLHKFSIALNQD